VSSTNGRDGMLRIDNLSVYYGGIQALKDVSLHLETGELLAIIGANGAGKTTLLRTLSGVLKARSGSIRFEGKELTRLSPFDIVALGIAHSPEGRQLFGGLTVLENLKLGAVQRTDRAAIEQDLARTFELFPVLKERRLQRAGTLSGGEQQMLAIGRALMARPRLLLLDEPSLGLAPLLVERNIRRDRPPQGRTRHATAGRTKRAYGAERGRSGLRDGDRPHQVARYGRRAGRQP